MKLTVRQLRQMVREQVSEKLIQDKCAGNRWHRRDGTFGDSKSAGSWSFLDSGCGEQGQYKVTGGKPTRDNSPCGSLNRKKLCQELEEDDTNELYQTKKIELLIRDTIKQELAKLKRGKGKCTYQDILNAMNQIDLARDGKLYAKKK